MTGTETELETPVVLNSARYNPICELKVENDIPATGTGLFGHKKRTSEEWRLRADTLTGKKLTDEQMEGLRKRSSRHLNKSATEGVMGYYKRQNEILENFSEVDTLMESVMSSSYRVASVGAPSKPGSDRLAMRLSFGFNMILFAAKVFASVESGSLSIITSALDSFLDLVCGLILFLTARSMRRDNKYRFPAGKSRMQPLGIIVFSCIMGTVGFQVLLEALRQLVGQEHVHHLESLNWLIAIMLTVIAIKFMLFMYCRNNASDIVRVYAEDHRNDVLTNSIGLAGAIAGDKLFYWIDPLGAILLAGYIIWNWGNTAIENVKALVGLSASPEFLQKLTFLCYNHHSEVMKIDTVRAYTFGPRMVAEVDVVLPRDMPLHEVCGSVGMGWHCVCDL